MAGPPFDLDNTHPASSDLISQYPTNEQAFRTAVEDWLSYISDPSTGKLKPTAFASPFEIQDTDPGAGSNPAYSTYRNSASPAAADLIGAVAFYGNDSSAAKTLYGNIVGRIDDPVNTTEDGALVFQVMKAGTLTSILTVDNAGVAGLMGTTASVDNRVVRWDGTTGRVQSSGVTIDDAGNVTATSYTGQLGANNIVGTISTANLPATTVYNNVATTFTATNTIATGATAPWSVSTGLNPGFASMTGAGQGLLIFNGNNPSASAGLQFNRGASFAVHFGLDTDNKMRMGGWSLGAASYGVVFGDGYTGNSGSLTINGNITASGNITANSDERLKENWQALSEDLVVNLASLKAGDFDFIAGGSGVGVSAQELQTFMPNAVLADDKGYLSVAYGNAALVGVVALARKIVELEQRLA